MPSPAGNRCCDIPAGFVKLFAAEPKPVNDGAIGNFCGNGVWKSLELKSTSPTSCVLAAAVVGVTTMPREVISTPLVIVIVFKVVRVSIVCATS